MKLFVERTENSKSPFIARLSSRNLRYMEDSTSLDPYPAVLQLYQEKDSLARLDHLYHLEAKLDARLRDRFRSKKDLKHALTALELEMTLKPNL